MGAEVEPDDRQCQHHAEEHGCQQADPGETGVEIDMRTQRHLRGTEQAEQVYAKGADEKAEEAAGGGE